MIWLLSHPLHILNPSFPSVSSTVDTKEKWERETTWWRVRGRGWGRSQAYDGEKNGSFMNHSALSAITIRYLPIIKIKTSHVDAEFSQTALLASGSTDRMLFCLSPLLVFLLFLWQAESCPCLCKGNSNVRDSLLILILRSQLLTVTFPFLNAKYTFYTNIKES